MNKTSHTRQLDLLASRSLEVIPALPDGVLREAREALQKLLVEVIMAERQMQETCDEQDHT